MIKVVESLVAWWNRPPAKQRILSAMSDTEWRHGLDVIKAAKVSIGFFYANILDAERIGIVESKFDDRPVPESRQGHRRRLYRLKADIARA